MNYQARTHGGPDAQGAVLYDFSTNSNGCGACPSALDAVQQADATRYPDPAYTALRSALANFYAVAPWRIVLAGSASEFIFRITSYAHSLGANSASIPLHAYGDYAQAAHALELQLVPEATPAQLVWLCEPSSPLGHSYLNMALTPNATVVLDGAYQPMRLSGQSGISPADRQQVWQLYSPNKALGLTGVRAAFAIAPLKAQAGAAQLQAMAPSWLVGAHGVALLHAWTQPQTQHWLVQCLAILQQWKQSQITGLEALGWTVQPSDTPFFAAQPPAHVHAALLCSHLRSHGIQLRDATSFGLAGWFRLGVLGPQAQSALFTALAKACI